MNITDELIDAAMQGASNLHPPLKREDCRRILTAALSAATAVGLAVKALEFLTAVEALLDWMNGNELAADHKRQRPEDFARICASMLSLRASLEAQEGKDNG